MSNFNAQRTELQHVNARWTRTPLGEGWKGALLGGALGSIAGPVGTAAGAALGHGIGDAVANTSKKSSAWNSNQGFWHRVMKARKNQTVGDRAGELARKWWDGGSQKKASADYLKNRKPLSSKKVQNPQPEAPAAPTANQGFNLSRLKGAASSIKSGSNPELNHKPGGQPSNVSPSTLGAATQPAIDKLKKHREAAKISPELASGLQKIGVTPKPTDVKKPVAPVAPKAQPTAAPTPAKSPVANPTVKPTAFDAIRERKFKSMKLTPEQERKAREKAATAAKP